MDYLTMHKSNSDDDFDEYDVRKLSKNTLTAYRRDIQQLLKEIELLNIDIKDIQKKNLIQLRTRFRDEHGLAPTSINRKMISWKIFFDFMGIEIEMPKQIPISQSNIIEKVECTNNDIIRTLRQIEKDDSYKAIRTKTILLTLFYTGARISEALSLKVNDIPTTSKGFTVKIIGKGNKERNLYIPKPLETALKEYLKHRLDTHSEALFTGERGAFTRNTFANDLNHYASSKGKIKTGVVHPHALRHLFCQNVSVLSEQGKCNLNYSAIQEIMGHTFKTVTDRYAMLKQETVITEMAKLEILLQEKK